MLLVATLNPHLLVTDCLKVLEFLVLRSEPVDMLLPLPRAFIQPVLLNQEPLVLQLTTVHRLNTTAQDLFLNRVSQPNKDNQVSPDNLDSQLSNQSTRRTPR